VSKAVQATRQRLIDASAQLFGRYGFSATGVKAILTASNAPFGSMYHFFPGGKEELGAAAIAHSGLGFKAMAEAFFDAEPDVAQATWNFFDGAAVMMELTDYADACPIATIALEVASVSEPMRIAANDAFESWLGVMMVRYRASGLSPKVSRQLAVQSFCAIEGAFLMARSARNAEALRICGAAMRDNINRERVTAHARSRSSRPAGPKPSTRRH
jgi:TetR/AcrR family transcriptional regulator, lmrAB and yxaGH operons repressor